MERVLTAWDTNQKLTRMAYEILEHNDEEQELVLIGIKNRGCKLAEMLFERLSNISELKLTLEHIKINKRHPIDPIEEVSFNAEDLSGRNILIVDDVANSGRTILYAMKPILAVLPKKIQLAVLVDRKHKLFPIHCDFVGLSLNTTIHENISVQFDDALEVYLN